MATQGSFYPLASPDLLRTRFVGRSIRNVPTPAAIIDLAIVKRNCDRMLKATRALGVSLRPHVKTHKTTEITRLQLGDETSSIKLVASTVAEIEHLLPLLRSFQSQGKHVDILYGIPLPPSEIPRLVSIAGQEKVDAVSFMIDHPGQVDALVRYQRLSGSPARIFVKCDTGYHRAGVKVGGPRFDDLMQKIKAAEEEHVVVLQGFYSHAGHSYGVKSAVSAIDLVAEELAGVSQAALAAREHLQDHSRHFTLSIGATPTVNSLEQVVDDRDSLDSASSGSHAFLQHLEEAKSAGHTVEVHAGVYTLLDLQQLATRARSYNYSHLGLTIIAEVCSTYGPEEEGRSESGEALIAAGSLALGREPCPSYVGWGLVSDWNISPSHQAKSPMISGWKVGRISQEHGSLTRNAPSDAEADGVSLSVGQKVRIWPNHACIASAGHGFFFVIDSSKPDEDEEIIDVWIRWRGW